MFISFSMIAFFLLSTFGCCDYANFKMQMRTTVLYSPLSYLQAEVSETGRSREEQLLRSTVP